MICNQNQSCRSAVCAQPHGLAASSIRETVSALFSNLRATLEVTMVFVLDNYDSFTYNLVQYLGELGADVVVRRNDEITVEAVETMHPERILLSPGPCTPQEAGISIALVRHFAGIVPLLGV